MKRILITEDDGLIAEIYRDSFEREGFSAEVAADGAIALHRLKEIHRINVSAGRAAGRW